VNFIHKDLETPIHDLVDFLRVELFRDGGVIGHIRKEHRYQLPFPFDGAPGSKDLIGQEFWGVRLGLRIIYRRGFLGLSKIITAFIAKFEAWRWSRSAIWTTYLQRCAAIPTKYGVFRILKLAGWAFHSFSQFLVRRLKDIT
jgi:hypothetical protein